MITRLAIILGIILVAGGGLLFSINQTSMITDKPINESPVLPQTSENLKARVSEPPNPAPLSEISDSREMPEKIEKPAKPEPIKNPPPQTQAAAPCSGTNFEQFQCYRKFYSEQVKKEGPQAAMNHLRALYDKDSFVRSQCHQLTHIVGRTAATIFPALPETFKNGDGFCWSGYYHGALETVATDIGKTKLPEKLDEICEGIPGKQSFSFDYYNCVHGLGHGIMAILSNELFDSLEMCDYLTGPWEQSSCWSGAYMENIIADEINHFSKYLKADDPLYPCNAVKERYKNTCYLMQTSRMLAVVGFNFEKVFDLCSTVGEPHINTCYQSLGRDASGKTVSDLQRTKDYCMMGKDFRQRSNCVIGAVKDFISYYHSDKEAKELCASLSTDLHETCYTTAQNYYKLF